MIERPIKIFDLVQFQGSGNVASVRQVNGLACDQTATLRYMRDDGELDYSPFEMRAETVRKLCVLIDVVTQSNRVGRTARRAPKPAAVVRPLGPIWPNKK